MTLENRNVLGPVPGEEPPARAVRARPTPIFCYALIAVCVLIFLLDPGAGMPSTVPHLRELLLLFAPRVREGEWWRVVTGALTHGGLIHIGFNMWAVTSLGFLLERAIGSWKMAFVSIIGALGASAFSMYFSPTHPTVGASGMILSWAGVMMPLLSSEGRRSIGGWLLQVAVISFLPGVSWQAHLGGFLIGLPCGLAIRQGPKKFALLAPILLFFAGALTVFSVFPQRWGN